MQGGVLGSSDTLELCANLDVNNVGAFARPLTFSLSRSLNSCVSSCTDFWMLGAFLGAAALLCAGRMSSWVKEASSSLPARASWLQLWCLLLSAIVSTSSHGLVYHSFFNVLGPSLGHMLTRTTFHISLRCLC